MNESSKLAQNSAIISDLRELFSLLRARRTKVFLYGSVLAFTAYLAFCPAENGSPRFNDFFSYTSASTSPYQSRISSIVSYMFPNSSSPQIPAYFPEGDGGGWSRSGGASEGSLSSAAGGEMDQNSGFLARKKDTAAGSVAVAKGSGGGGGGADRRSGILAKNETMSHGAAVVEGDGGGGAMAQKSGVLGKNDATAAKGDAIANADGVRSQRGRVSEGKSSTAGSRAGDPKSEVSAKKNETAAEDDVTRSERGDTSVSNLTNSSGATKDQKSEVFLAKKNETAAAADGVSAEKAGISSPNNHTSSRIQSQGNGVAKNTTSNRDSKTKGLGASSKTTVLATKNQTESDSQSKNHITSGVLPPKASDLQSKNTTKATDGSKNVASAARKNQAAKGEASRETKVSSSSKESTIAPQNNESLAKNQSISSKGRRNQTDWISSMKSCDIFQGKWVKDNSYPLYPEGSCPHIDEPFDCYRNGRPDRAYQKLRWQPIGCNIPRLNATDMLERLRGKRLVFVGDSLNRNMWESLVCVLRNSVKDKSKVFEASGRLEFRTEGSYSFVFKDFNCSVEFFRSPFLVQEWEMLVNNGTKETLRLDIIERSSSRYKDADVIVFNTGHWWTHEKTSKGKDYYQEGNHIYRELNVEEAFHKALNTWAKWVDTNVNPNKSLVVFRGYSSSHFSGGQWNSGGQCNKETEPIKNEKYLSSFPSMMTVLESVIKGMKTRVAYLNITRMTDYRKDAHPSIYRKQNFTDEERREPERFQDCSHWCLPGVPDSWNELLYAQLILKQHQLL